MVLEGRAYMKIAGRGGALSNVKHSFSITRRLRNVKVRASFACRSRVSLNEAFSVEFAVVSVVY